MNIKKFENWREIEDSLEPWDMEIMDKLLDDFEKEKPLENYSWENIMDIKKALWIGYTFKNKDNHD